MRSLHRLLAASAALVVSIVVPQTAHAHTDFDYSVPTDGASVGEAVPEITVAFTEPVTLVGPGFEVLDPQGRVLQPFAVTDDDMVFRLQLDPPLGGGLVAVKYEIAAADGHVLDGNFTFTVAVAEPVVTEPPTTPPPTSPPSTVPPDATVPAATIEPTASEPTTPATTPISPPAEPVDETIVRSGADTTDPAAGATADDTSGGSSTLLVVIGAAVVVAGAAVFLFGRSRRTPG